MFKSEVRKVRRIVVPGDDFRYLDWLEVSGHSKGRPIEWFQRVLLNGGKTEIEVGQFINKYVTLGVLTKLGNGNIRVECGINSEIKLWSENWL